MKNIFKGKFFSSICVLFHKIFEPGKVSPDSIVDGAEEIAAAINFAREVDKDVKAAGTDPANIAKALAASVKAHIGEIPASILNAKVEGEIITLCAEITGLDLALVESTIKTELGIA